MLPVIQNLYEIEEVRQETPTVKSFSFYSEEISRKAQPGQFLMISVPGKERFVDEFPISVASTKNNLVRIYVSKVGEGTAALHEKGKGDYLGARGPYGNGFDLEGYNVVAVVGGFASPPVMHYIERARKKKITVLQGAKAKNELLGREYFRKNVDLTCYATVDGSFGYHGLVTELMPHLFDVMEPGKPDMILASGPEAMLGRVCEITDEYGLDNVQLLVERITKCAIGVDGACCIGSMRNCRDGPAHYKKDIWGVTEFAKWTRDKSGMRVPIPGVKIDSFESFSKESFTSKIDPCLLTEIEFKSGIPNLALINPSMNVSGMVLSGQYGVEVARNGAGALVMKSSGSQKIEGFHGPNVTGNLVNAMGLPNPGIENLWMEIKDARKANVPIIQSLIAKSPEEANRVANFAVGLGPDGIEFNGSCPHTSYGSVEKDPELLKEITKAIVSVAHPEGIPVFVKVSANEDYVEAAKAAIEAGADGITAINTKRVMPMNEELGIPILGSESGYGGLSGREIRKLGMKVLSDLVAEVDVPIFYAGGVSWNYIDVLEHGASACQIGTETIEHGLGLFERLNEELSAYIIANRYENVKDIIGIRVKR